MLLCEYESEYYKAGTDWTKAGSWRVFACWDDDTTVPGSRSREGLLLAQFSADCGARSGNSFLINFTVSYFYVTSSLYFQVAGCWRYYCYYFLRSTEASQR